MDSDLEGTLKSPCFLLFLGLQWKQEENKDLSYFKSGWKSYTVDQAKFELGVFYTQQELPFEPPLSSEKQNIFSSPHFLFTSRCKTDGGGKG